MSAKTAEILKLTSSLSGPERVELAAHLLAEADGAADADWQAAWGQEVEARRGDVDRPEQWRSWAATLASARSAIADK